MEDLLTTDCVNQVEAVTRAQSKMPHFDALADEACLLYNRIAFRVLQGEDLKESIKAEVTGTRYESALSGKKPDCPPDGFVVHTMEWVIYWLLVSELFSEVVIGAANEGNDTDTVAAIAGGLAGLACGFEALPKSYCEILKEKEELNQLAAETHNIG